jgi:hypothetical protein
MFSTRRKLTTARISQLAGLSIAGHTIHHPVQTRTNTRRPVTWRFTRQLVMWRYFACVPPSPAAPTLVA